MPTIRTKVKQRIARMKSLLKNIYAQIEGLILWKEKIQAEIKRLYRKGKA